MLKFGRLLVLISLFVGSVSLVRTTAAQGSDFTVFWQGARFLLEGEPLYSVARDGGMVFKYPPWIQPFFLPLALLPLQAAKWVWGFLQLASLAYVIHWIQAYLSVRPRVWVGVLWSFWGLWIVHALDGQIVLPMLAIALAFGRAVYRPRKGFEFRLALLALALSVKIFTVFPLLEMKWTRKTLGAVPFVAALAFALSVPAILSEPHKSPFTLVSSWVEAATSAGKLLDPTQIRGRHNPGLPGYALRLAGVPAENSRSDVILSLTLAVCMGIGWSRLSRGFQGEQRWVGWMALTPVIHPLPWWHLFIFAFPAAAYSVNAAVESRNRRAIGLSLLGVFLIAMGTEKLWGLLGAFLELNAAKSWGVLCCLWAMIEVRRSQFPKGVPVVGRHVL